MDKQVCLNRGEEQDIENGSLWIYDNEIDWCTDTCSDGDVVTVLDSRRRFCRRIGTVCRCIRQGSGG